MKPDQSVTTDIVLRAVSGYGWLAIILVDGVEKARGSFRPTPTEALTQAAGLYCNVHNVPFMVMRPRAAHCELDMDRRTSGFNPGNVTG